MRRVKPEGHVYPVGYVHSLEEAEAAIRKLYKKNPPETSYFYADSLKELTRQS